ncbi:MAG: right-handed parallel beta-helix repeat-containing protein [Clostridia bacterium]|nr:right-handed parallel beta-helix repeat-containing protein [Clostridia bacterium]
MEYIKVIGADENLLPTAESGGVIQIEGDALLERAVRENGRVTIPAGLYELESDLYLEESAVYDFSGATIKSTEGYDIYVTAPRVTLMRLNAYVSLSAEEEADGFVLIRSRLCGGTKLYPRDLIVMHNVFDAPVDVYGENAILANNDFDDAPVELFDGNNTFFAGNRLVMSPVTDSYGRNDVFLRNEFRESGKTALTVKGGYFVTLAQNDFDGDYAAENSQNTLCTGNGKAPVNDGGHTYGDDVPKNMPEYGADMESLPPADYRRFMGQPIRETLRLPNLETGEVEEISVNNYLNAGVGCDRELILPPGSYAVKAGEKAHIYLEKVRKFSLTAYGAKLVCEDYTKPMLGMRDCYGVALRGYAVDFAMPANTQGRVLKVEDDHTIIWLADEGYPDCLCNEKWYAPQGLGEGYRKNSQRPYCDVYVDRKEALGQSAARVHFRGGHTLRVGDKVIFRGHTVPVNYYENCEATLVEDVTLYNGGGFGFMEFGGEGGTVLRRVLLTPGEPPVNGAPERLISVCDATHSTCMRRGIRVYDSFFEKMTDDATNVNGCYGDVLAVREEDGDTWVHYGTGTSRYTSVCADFRPGDRVMVYTQAGKLLYDGTAVSETRLEKDETWVKVQGRLIPEGDAVIQNASANGYGFAFENCVFQNNRSRGLLIKACGGVIRHCTLNDNGMSAILVKAEIEDGWGECGFTEDLLVENNLITRSGYFSGTELHTPIHISGDSTPTADPAYHNQKGITLRHNKITDRYTRYAISVNMAEDIVIEGNDVGSRVEKYKDLPDLQNPLCPDDDVTPIHLRGVGKVTVKGNLLPKSAQAEYEED